MDDTRGGYKSSIGFLSLSMVNGVLKSDYTRSEACKFAKK